MDIKPTFGSTTYVPATTTSEPIKYKEKKVSVIENEEDRFELSANYKQYLEVQRDIKFHQDGYKDIHQQFDVENLTKDEYSEMCKMLKDNGVLTAEEYAWLEQWKMYTPPSGLLGSMTEKQNRELNAMADKHPDPFRMDRILHFAAKRRDEGNPISFEQALELADPSKTPEWIDEDSYVSDKNIKPDSSAEKFFFSDSDSDSDSGEKFDFSDSDPNKKYNWMDVITERMRAVENLPHIKPEDKVSFKNASMKMLNFLEEIKKANLNSNNESLKKEENQAITD